MVLECLVNSHADSVQVLTQDRQTAWEITFADLRQALFASETGEQD